MNKAIVAATVAAVTAAVIGQLAVLAHRRATSMVRGYHDGQWGCRQQLVGIPDAHSYLIAYDWGKKRSHVNQKKAGE